MRTAATLTPLIVPPSASLRRAMQAIDDGRLGIALVVDAERRLRGTVTDGDLRRAVLRGIDLDSPVDAVMSRRFTAVKAGATPAAVLDLMRARSIQQVPVVDDDGILQGLFCLRDLTRGQWRANWAVIMAGGEGRRLRPLTDRTPKPMLPVGDRPLLENLIRLLVGHRFRDVFIAINYLGDQIQEYFGDGQSFNCRIRYLRETRPLGTAGALSLLPERPAEPLLVLNGDLATDVDLSALMDYHVQAACLATQCVFEHIQMMPFGVVRCDGYEVIGLEEKPTSRQLVNAGIYVLSPGLLDLVPPDREFTMPELLARACRSGYPVAAFPIREEWADIGRIDDYEHVREQWAARGARRP